MPRELQPSSRIGVLLDFKVKSHQAIHEKELVDRYAKMARDNTFDKLDQSSRFEIFGKQENNSGADADSGRNNVPTVTASPISDKSSNHHENDPYDVPPQMVKKTSNNAVEEFNMRQEKLDKMCQATGQGLDVCHFYLEMVEWDYDQALHIFNTSS